MLDLVNTINRMIDQLAIFAAEVKKVAREVGTEGKLGGQAEPGSLEGMWQEITYVDLTRLAVISCSTHIAMQHVRQHDGKQPHDTSAWLCADLGSGYGRRLQPLHHG